MSRIRSTTVHPYDARLHYATTPEAWTKLRRRFGERVEPPGSLGETGRIWDSHTGRTHLLIWVDLARHHNAHDLLRTISHEAYHAAAGLLNALGDDTTGDREAAAYLLDWTVHWLVRNTPGLSLDYQPGARP